MKSALDTLEYVNGKFVTYASGHEIEVSDVEFDNQMFALALNQILEHHFLTQNTQKILIRKFTISSKDFDQISESPYFYAELKGVAEESRHIKTYMCNIKLTKFSLERIEKYTPKREDDDNLMFSNVCMILYNGEGYSAELDTREE